MKKLRTSKLEMVALQPKNMNESEFEREGTYVFRGKNGGETRASSMGRRGIGATPFGKMPQGIERKRKGVIVCILF